MSHGTPMLRVIAVAGMIATATVAQAGLFVNQYGIGSDYSNGSVSAVNGANITIKTATLSGGGTQQATTNEQNFGTVGNMAGQSFTATQTGKLAFFETYMALSDTATFGLELWDMGTAPFDEPWNTADSPIGGAGNLLASRTNSIGVSASGNNVYQFYFTGADEIPVEAGRRYLLRFTKTGTGTLTWFRNGNGLFYTGGDAYRFDTNSVTPSDPNGVILRTSDVRDFALGVGYVVPEPASLALLGMGSIALLRRRRC